MNHITDITDKNDKTLFAGDSVIINNPMIFGTGIVAPTVRLSHNGTAVFEMVEVIHDKIIECSDLNILKLGYSIFHPMSLEKAPDDPRELNSRLMLIALERS